MEPSMPVICLRNMFMRPHSEDVSYQLLGCKDVIRVILICADARPRISFFASAQVARRRTVMQGSSRII
jgi:hypothetical protein